jgi:hypothetical protein
MSKDSPTFTTVVEKQCQRMLAAAKRLDERGYIVLVWCRNKDPEGAAPYGIATIMLRETIKAWKQKYRRSPVVVNVQPLRQTVADVEAIFAGHIFDASFRFEVTIQRATKLRAIVVALELLTGLLERTEKQGGYVFSGEGRTAFEALLRVLEMPHHRELMTRR